LAKLLISSLASRVAAKALRAGLPTCDPAGSAVSRTTYATLFGVIGTNYGAGDGSTTFNLPDLVGRVVVGVSTSGPTLINALGKSDGVTKNSRSISHHHTLAAAASGSGNQGALTWGGAFGSTSGDANNLDYPAFLALNHIIKT
jgi:hypothetical protein